MADTEIGPASSEMEVSSLPPSADAKDRAPSSTPSSTSTDSSTGAEPPQVSSDDISNITAGETDEAMAPPTSDEEEAQSKEEAAIDNVDEINVNYNKYNQPSSGVNDVADDDNDDDGDDIDNAESKGAAVFLTIDDDLPSDEEKEWLQKESFVEPDEEDVIEDDKVRAEQELREAALAETRRKQQEVAQKMAEVEAKLQKSNQEIPFDEVERSVAEIDTNDSIESKGKAVTEETATRVDQEEIILNTESDTLNEDTKDSTEISGEAAGKEVAVEIHEYDIIQKQETAKESLLNRSPLKSEPEASEDDTEDSAENTGEVSGEEVATQSDKEENTIEEGKVNEPLEKESPSIPQSDTEGCEKNESDTMSLAISSGDEKNAEPINSSTKATAVQVQFDLSNDDDQINDKDNEESVPVGEITPRTGRISFSQAFSSKPLPPLISPSVASLPKTPNSTSNASINVSSNEESNISDAGTPTSHSALSASKNKKASDLISKYQEKVAHESLPGDAVPIKSSSYQSNFYTDVSPGTARILQQKSADTFVELNSLPDMHSVRDKFEKSARKSGGKFEFGESFRQKQRYEQLSEKEREEEAKVTMRGFNEKVLNQGKTASGEIDTSHLPKSFTFDMSSTASLMPNDGVCRVDYINADFRAKVFVVHKTRGMLLLQDKHVSTSPSATSGKKKKKKKKKTVPGGKINEEEFLAAAEASGSPQVQLQIAAMDAAARHVYETTGLDIRQQADRLKPAVLCLNPAMNAARGYEYLRNENMERLYYFLQVDEEDFEKLQDAQGDAAAPTNLTRPSEDPGDDVAPAKLKRTSEDPGDDPLTLKLSSDYSGYEFVQDPMVASKVLKKDGNDAAIALAMIMSAAAQESKGPTTSEDKTTKDPDAKATEFANKSMLDDELDDDEIGLQPDNGAIRTIGMKEDRVGKPTKSGDVNSFYDEEAKLNIKTSGDTADNEVGVGCCCSFW